MSKSELLLLNFAGLAFIALMVGLYIKKMAFRENEKKNKTDKKI